MAAARRAAPIIGVLAAAWTVLAWWPGLRLSWRDSADIELTAAIALFMVAWCINLSSRASRRYETRSHGATPMNTPTIHRIGVATPAPDTSSAAGSGVPPVPRGDPNEQAVGRPEQASTPDADR